MSGRGERSSDRPMIALEGVEQRFGDFALTVPRLRAERGDYLVVLGPSGCGKSLLLGTIAGIHDLAAGRLLLDGVDRTDAPPDARGVGLVFQRLSLFPHLGVADNIAFGLKVRGAPKAQRRARVAELVETLGLEGLLERTTTTLSGGESQKVAIARALAPRPSVLLLDEPLSAVDHNARLELRAELRRLHEALGITTVHVTHDREEARALGDRCAVMLGGRIVQQDAIEAVFSRPRCVFVARFLGLEVDPGALARRPGGCSELCLAGGGRCDRAVDAEELEDTACDPPAADE